MSSSSYTPNEPADIISAEITWIQGAFLSSLLCGVQITLSTISFFAVLRQPLGRRLRIALLVYVFLLGAVMTAGQQFSLLFIQMGFIESRDYPGGPSAFLRNQFATPFDLASSFLFVVANFMTESLMVWRCKVVCCTGDHPVWIGIVLPSVLLISEYVTGSLFLHDVVRGRYAMDYVILYSGLSLSLNVTVTVVIAGRLLLHRRRIVRLFGSGHGSCYVSAATVLVESASLYTGFVILVIVFFSLDASASNILQQMVAQVESIASLLIIYRIAQGKGWNEDTEASSLCWRGGDTEAPAVEHELVFRTTPDPDGTGGAHTTPSMVSKEDETPTSASAGFAN